MGATRNGRELMRRARAWAAMKREPHEIADALATSPAMREALRKTVANAVRVAKRLIPELQRMVESDDLSFAKAVRLSALPPGEQRLRSQHRTGAGGSDVMKRNDIKALIRRIESSSKSAAWIESATMALRCALDRGNIPGIWPPPQ